MIAGVSGLALTHMASNARELALSYGTWSGIRTNHVISSDGKFVDETGSSRGLSTKEDLELLIELRTLSDLVIVDAATARREKYRKLSSAHLAIVSASGNFNDIPAATATEGVTLFSSVNPSLQDKSALDHVMISKGEPFGTILEWAKSHQMTSVLLEAGPTLTRLAFTANLVCQSAITVTPAIKNLSSVENLNPFSNTGELTSVASADDATFTLWSY